MTGRLSGKVAIITGAGQGIGKAIARKFASENAAVAIIDLDRERGDALVKEIEQANGKALFIHADVSDLPMAQEMARNVHDHFGRIDILVNNAGIIRDATLLKMPESDFDAVISVNLKGAYNCTQSVAPIMIERSFGRIINMASRVAIYGSFGQTNYVASKAGLIGMTKVWARELGKKGICVNAIAPGMIDTDMMQSIPSEILQRKLEQVPLGRMGTPNEVANLFAFLASDEASYINGAVISVDGGLVS